MFDLDEWYYRQLKGRAAAHVARGGDRPEAIVKAARTIIGRGGLKSQALATIVAEVESESVRPFLGPPWNQPERLGRFEDLTSLLEA
jgi:hypothetical protein